MALSYGTGTGGADIVKSWPKLHGEDSWKGLLDPLDTDLRKSIISYGELVQATGDGFNKETHSPHYGLCMYGYDDLLTKSGAAAASHYKITKFVYATEEKKPTWIGYVAAATDEGVAALGRRDVVVAWRGSVTGTEWDKDMQFIPAFPWPVLGLVETITHPLALVHSGFLSLYTASGGGNAAGDDDDDSTSSIRGSARDQVLEEVKRLMELYKHEETSITVIGHSLGSALAILNAVDLVGNGVNRSCPVTAIVFACPHVGNNFFKDAFDSFKDLRALHVRNKKDPVPGLMDWLPDLGVTLPIDTTLSSYLKDPEKTAHNLQCYLHGVAGEVGDDGKFKLVVDRDFALVNKDADALKDEYHVPASWWVAQYKSMVKNDQGKWELKDFEQY